MIQQITGGSGSGGGSGGSKIAELIAFIIEKNPEQF